MVSYSHNIVSCTIKQWESTGVVTRRRQNGQNVYTYNGNNAIREWESICGNTPLPIETDGGDGTAGGHWDEDCLRGELMTGTDSLFDD